MCGPLELSFINELQVQGPCLISQSGNGHGKKHILRLREFYFESGKIDISSNN